MMIHGGGSQNMRDSSAVTQGVRGPLQFPLLESTWYCRDSWHKSQQQLTATTSQCLEKATCAWNEHMETCNCNVAERCVTLNMIYKHNVPEFTKLRMTDRYDIIGIQAHKNPTVITSPTLKWDQTSHKSWCIEAKSAAPLAHRALENHSMLEYRLCSVHLTMPEMHQSGMITDFFSLQ